MGIASRFFFSLLSFFETVFRVQAGLLICRELVTYSRLLQQLVEPILLTKPKANLKLQAFGHGEYEKHVCKEQTGSRRLCVLPACMVAFPAHAHGNFFHLVVYNALVLNFNEATVQLSECDNRLDFCFFLAKLREKTHSVDR